MIIANITTYVGTCGDAEHYYCQYCEVDDDYKFTTYNQTYTDVDLVRILTSESECLYLNKKDRSRNYIGGETFRFNSINQIHDTLISQFKDKKIISYLDNIIFSQSLYYNVDVLKDVFLYLPNSVYKDIIPENYIIKCSDCGKEFKLEDISKETLYNDRILIVFNRISYKNKCCGFVDLVWNVIL